MDGGFRLDAPALGRRPPAGEAVLLREALESGLALWRGGRAFEAHEVWEDRWRLTPPGDDRRLLHGLIQIAAATVQAERGVASGAARLWRKALARLEPLGDAHAGVDLAALRVAAAARLATSRCR